MATRTFFKTCVWCYNLLGVPTLHTYLPVCSLDLDTRNVGRCCCCRDSKSQFHGASPGTQPSDLDAGVFCLELSTSLKCLKNGIFAQGVWNLCTEAKRSNHCPDQSFSLVEAPYLWKKASLFSIVTFVAVIAASIIVNCCCLLSAATQQYTSYYRHQK